jgi:hypothetical protein
LLELGVANRQMAARLDFRHFARECPPSRRLPLERRQFKCKSNLTPSQQAGVPAEQRPPSVDAKIKL